MVWYGPGPELDNNKEMELLLCLLLICNSVLVACFVISIIVNMCIPILVLSLNNCVEKGMHLISATNILSAQNAVSERNKILATNMIYRNLEINFYQSALRYRIRH